MNIKTKKIKLTKILIGSSLLLSTVSLPLALTSCSKNKNTPSEDNEQQKILTSYLFNLDNPQLLDDKDEPIDNKDTLFLKDNVKNLVNDLKTKDGYKDDFLTKLDSPIEKIYKKGENDQYFEVNDLGEIVVHYLNSSLAAGKCLSFAVNEEVFSGFDKFEDIKNNISCSKIKLNDHLTIDSKEVKGFEIVDKQDVKFCTGFDKASNKDQFYDEKKDDAKISDIKKIKIDLNDTSSNGFLITFKPAKGEGNKTIIFKYVDDKEVELYKEEFYKNFEEKKVEEIVDDFFITCDADWGKYLESQFDSASADIKKKFGDKKLTQDATNAKLLSDITSNNFANLEEKLLDDFLGLLHETKLVDFVFDVKKSKEHKTLCLDQNSLKSKVQINGKNVKYSLCINDSLKTEIESKMKINIAITNNDKDVEHDNNNHTLNVVLNSDDFKDNDGLVNFKLTCKYGDNIFWSKEVKKIEIKFDK